MKPTFLIASTSVALLALAAPGVAQTVTTPSPTPQPVLTTSTVTGTTTTTTGTTGTVTGTSGTSSSTLSAYDSLSIGNRKIARALFDAQPAPISTTPGSPTTTGGPTGTGTTTTPGTTTTAPKPMTLDEIAALKQGGQGWGQVFKTMQAQGLVSAKNLGQVVSRYNHLHRDSTSGAVTGTNRLTDADDHEKGAVRGGDDHRGREHGGAKSGVGSAATVGHRDGGEYGRSAGMSSVRSGHGESQGSHGGGRGK